MSLQPVRCFWIRATLVALGLLLVFTLAGCDEAATTRTDKTPAPEPTAEQPAPEEPEAPAYTSWEIYINDDDSFEKGGITYEIALNLTASNDSAEVPGTYTGEATAKTSSTGDIGGQQLNASAIANSSKLTFTLEDPTAGGDLALLTEDAVYAGTGSITMKAAGSGTIGPAGGGFSNNSSQPLKVSVSGTAVTLEIPIDGHTYTFEGTLSGR